MSKQTARKPKLSTWYRSDCIRHANAMRKPMRSSAKRDHDADAKAIEYAEWLLKRDGVDIQALADAARDVWNANISVKAIKAARGRYTGTVPIGEYETPEAAVEWLPCSAGMRPARIVWRWNWQGGCLPFHTLDLPNWSFVEPEVIELIDEPALLPV